MRCMPMWQFAAECFFGRGLGFLLRWRDIRDIKVRCKNDRYKKTGNVAGFFIFVSLFQTKALFRLLRLML